MTRALQRLDRERAKVRDRVRAAAGNLFAGSLEYGEALHGLSRLSVPEFAECCAVDLMDESGVLWRMAAAHSVPAAQERAREDETRYPFDRDGSCGALRVVRTGKHVFCPTVSPHCASSEAAGWGSAMVLPLTARARTFGAITLDHRTGAAPLYGGGPRARLGAGPLGRARYRECAALRGCPD